MHSGEVVIHDLASAAERAKVTEPAGAVPGVSRLRQCRGRPLVEGGRPGLAGLFAAWTWG